MFKRMPSKNNSKTYLILLASEFSRCWTVWFNVRLKLDRYILISFKIYNLKGDLGAQRPMDGIQQARH